MKTGSEIAGEYGLRRVGREWRGRCPACGYDKGLTVSEDKGKVLLWCSSCSTKGDNPPFNVVFGGATGAPSSSATAPRDDSDRRAAAAALIERARPLTPGDPVMNYLGRVRHVPVPPGAPLRYLPEAKHPSGARVPCMLAILQDSASQVVAVHRTFLQPGGTGKYAVEPYRMTLGPVAGAAVRLFPAAAKLVVGEGIETTLSAARLLGLPAWSAVSAGNMADSLVLPAEVREVVIAADHDDPGLQAAARAAARWKAEGRTVRLAKPDRRGADFNDLLLDRVRRGAI